MTQQTVTFDSDTKKAIKENFDQIKPQLQQSYPSLSEQDLSQGKSDPNKLVEAASRSTGQDKEQVASEIRRLAMQHQSR